MFEEGQRVKVLVDRAYSGKLSMRGRQGTVLHNADSLYTIAYVRMDGYNTDRRYVRGEHVACEVFGNDQLEFIKQEENMSEIKAGDYVKLVTDGGYEDCGFVVGGTYKVVEVASPRLVYLEAPEGAQGALAFLVPSEAVKAEPKPAKAKSQKITVDQVQVGDGIVAFFDNEGAEIRIKGVAHHKDSDGDWLTEGGGFLTYEGGLDIEAIYLLNRPEPKKPEILDGVYWVTEEGHKASPWKVTVANEKAEWKTNDGKHVYGTYENLVAVKSGKYETGTPVTKFHTTDPTPPKELTDLEKFVREDYVGARFRSPLTGLTYKVTAKGKVKGRYLHLEDDEWDNMNYTFDSFHQRIVEGSLEVL